MLNLNDMHLFVETVENGGFAAAGRSLHMSKSTLSDRVRKLETELGVRLLNRNTRRFGLTDAGEVFYAEALNMVRHAEAAEQIVRSRATEPSGLVRYTVAVSEAQYALRPAVSDFLIRHPKVSVFEHATDREVDFFADGYDLAIRAHPGQLSDSRIIQRVLGTADWHLFAGPDYIAQHRPITSPKDLAEHPALFTRRAAQAHEWKVRPEAGGDEQSVKASPRIVSDSMGGLKEMAKSGLGLLALPAYVCRNDVKHGRLVRVLPGWIAGRSTLSALTPERRGQLPAVRALLDHLSTEIPKAIKA